MEQLNVPAGFIITSYEQDGRFVLLFAPTNSVNPTSEPETIAISMTPETLDALTDYFEEPDD